ncbi:MAG: hypothetical protein LBQ83_01380 [Candidatus Margulisbacteria bacterium]|jgi:hypothetical protein|nr:hypothetical protein [Candidatus Margulisiibacteriota bacterium]
MAREYAGIKSGEEIRAADMNAALNTKLNLLGNVKETILGQKEFEVSPTVPTKVSASGNSPTVIATEAQVYNVQSRLNTEPSLNGETLNRKLTTTGTETIYGTKTFNISPPLTTGKSTFPTGDTATTKTAVATEAQVSMIACWNSN